MEQMKDFYIFSSKLVSANIQVSSDQITSDEDWDRVVRGTYENLRFPILFKVTSGKNWCDILDTGWPGLYIVSEKLKSILENNNITGRKFFEVIIYDKKDKKIDGYYGLSFTGKCSSFNIQRSNFIMKQLVPNGPKSKYYVGYTFDINTWDNLDMFVPIDSFHTVITKKTMALLKKSNLTNLRFESLAEIEIPEFSLK